MGIRVKNLHNTILHLTTGAEVTASATIPVATAIVPFDGFISNVVAACGSAGSGTVSSIVDVHYLGTTIFSDATKITLTATTGVASYSALSSTPYNVTAGAVFTLHSDTVSTSFTAPAVDIIITKSEVYTISTLSNQAAAL